MAKEDVSLSTGRVVTHRPTTNGASEAIILGDESAPMTDAEWDEYCEVVKARSRKALGK